MNKQALSVTLDTENVVWLQAQARLRRARSLSAALDQVLAEARAGADRPVRSVVRTLRIDAADPDLRSADEAMRTLFTPDRPSSRPHATGPARRRG